MISICTKQIRRDRAYRDELHTAAALIDARREQLGRQPTPREVEDIGRGRVSYYRRIDWPEKLVALGALADDDYMIVVMRPETFAHYYSWNGEDTCDSGAWTPLLAVGAPLAAASVLMLWFSRRRRGT